MHPIHDLDVLVLMAAALSAKRRPAELVEIVAATELLQGFIPLHGKLVDAFHRLAGQGLISEAGGSYALTPVAQAIMADPPKKASTAERMTALKTALSAYQPAGECPPIQLTVEQVAAAATAHRTAVAGPGRNLLMPKPKIDEAQSKRAAQWRRINAARRRKG
jgi:hypothetical protein